MADYLRESGVKWLWEKIKTLLSAKQDKLVSGSNIKTINGTSLLGSGDVSISGGLGGGTVEYKEIQLSPSNADAIIPRHVNSSNVWAVQNNSDVACLFLVHKGDKIKIQANASYYCVYTLLTTKDIDYTVAPPFVGDWRRTTVNANQEVEFEVPQRCYLYIYNKASAGGNYFPQVAIRNAVFTGLSEVALRAGQADKLTIARTINLSQGAIGTATEFDGSKNINIPVTTMYDSYLKWGGKLIPNGMSPLDATSPIFSANRVAFFPTDKMMVEYTNDGGVTWLDYGVNDLNKTVFTNYELGNAFFHVGKKDADITPLDMVKVTFDFDGTSRYFFLDKILLRVSYVPSTSNKVYIDIITETHATDTAESIVNTYTYKYLMGYGGWNSIPIPAILVGSSRRNDCVRKFSIILKAERNQSRSPCLGSVYFIANTDYSPLTGYFRAGHIYTYDASQNATFPAKVTAPSANITNIEATDINSTGKISGANGKATGSRSVALGSYCTAEGYYTTAIGYQAKAKGYYTKAIGTFVEASSDYQTVIGKNNATSTHAFVIGWGTDDAKKNIFSVDTNGNVYGTKFITSGGTNQQVVLGNGSLKSLDELSPITDADKAKLGVYDYTKIVDGDSYEFLTWEITEDPEVGAINSYEQRIEKDDHYIVAHFDLFKDGDGNKHYNNYVEVGAPGNYVILSPMAIEGYCTDGKSFYIDGNRCKAEQFVKHDGTATQILMADGSVKELSEISGGSGEDGRYTQFINALYDSNACPIIPSEVFFRNATWVDYPEDNEATLDFYNKDAKTLFYDGEKWVEDGMAATALYIPYANNTTSGLMSAADKQKLDALGSNIGGVGVPETLNCNTTYVVELEADDNLSITGFVAPTTLFGNYTVHLKTSTNNSISLPSTLLWANGEQPVFEDNTCYELSITATFFNAEYVYKAVLVAFK